MHSLLSLAIELALQSTFPADLSAPATRDFLDEHVTAAGLKCAAPRTAARLLDKLVGHYLEDAITAPTFTTTLTPATNTVFASYGLTPPTISVVTSTTTTTTNN